MTGTVSSGAQSAAQGAQSAVQGVAEVAKKAKVPAIAGGVAVAGLAGAAAANARSRRRKVLGVKVPRGNPLKKVDGRKLVASVSDAAERADRFSKGVSSVARTVQEISGTTNKAMKKT